MEGLDLRLLGSTRNPDGGSWNVFAMRGPSGGELYGEFVKRWEDDQETYGIEIVSLGYFSKSNLDNPRPGARAAFRADNEPPIRRAVVALFAETDDLPFPLSSPDGFNGSVNFRDGWIRLEP